MQARSDFGQEHGCAPGLRSARETGVSMSDSVPRISDSQVQTESEVQTQFVQQNLRRIFLLIYRIVGNVDDAQDLTQETFIKALQRQSQLKDLERAAGTLAVQGDRP